MENIESTIDNPATIARREERKKKYRNQYDRMIELLEDHEWNEAVEMLKEEASNEL